MVERLIQVQLRALTCSFWLAASAAARRSLRAALSRAARFCAKSSSYSSCRTSFSWSNALQATEHRITNATQQYARICE